MVSRLTGLWLLLLAGQLLCALAVQSNPLHSSTPDLSGLAAPQLPPGHNCIDIGRLQQPGGTLDAPHNGYISHIGYDMLNTVGSTTPQTCYNSVEVPRSPHQSDGACGYRECNGYEPLSISKFGEEASNSLSKTNGDCYRDQDCQWYYRDSGGLTSGEIIGTCQRVSDTQSECVCTYPYFGRNCQFKHCPNASHNGLECGGPSRGTCNSQIGECTCLAAQTSDLVGDVPYPSHHGRSQLAAPYGGNHITEYFGKACELRKCPNKCSNQGICVFQRDGQDLVCKCNPGFFGEDCSSRNCPLSYRGYVCDRHGSCDTDTGHCVCDDEYYGRDCHFKKSQGWYSQSGPPVHRFYHFPQWQINTNPDTKAHYQERSCYKTTFGTFDRRAADHRLSIEDPSKNPNTTVLTASGTYVGPQNQHPNMDSEVPLILTQIDHYAGPQTTVNTEHHYTLIMPQTSTTTSYPSLKVVTADGAKTIVEKNTGVSRTRYYQAYNDTFYLTSRVRYDESGRQQLIESTSMGDLSGKGQSETLNYRTTSESNKLC